MTPVQKLEAAIAKLESLKSGSTQDPWITGDSASLEALPMQTVALTFRGYDKADAELIVTLHRTIDAQRSILIRALNLSVAKRGQIGDAEIHLANAILGES